jgi:hypothetical protein
MLLKALEEIPKEDRVVVVSQWTSMLDIIHLHLRKHGYKTISLNGKIPVKDRTELVTRFNSGTSSRRVSSEFFITFLLLLPQTTDTNPCQNRSELRQGSILNGGLCHLQETYWNQRHTCYR